MVPTCYGRQAILYEFEGLMTSIMSALIDSNRVAECKALLLVCFLPVGILQYSGCLHILTSPVADVFLQLNH